MFQNSQNLLKRALGKKLEEVANNELQEFQYEQIIEALKKSRDDREYADHWYLCDMLRVRIDMFKHLNMKYHELRDITEELRYRAHPHKHCVINFGEKGYTFYILVKGSISIWLPYGIAQIKEHLD